MKNNNITVNELNEATQWTYADTAKAMAEIMPDFDWDSWKDEMKEGSL